MIQIITDDAECKRILVENNVLEAFSAGHPKPLPGPHREDFAFNTPTHHVIMRKYVDYPKPEDNGYSALLVSRTLPPEIVALLFQEWINEGRYFNGASAQVEIELPQVVAN